MVATLPLARLELVRRPVVAKSRASTAAASAPAPALPDARPFVKWAGGKGKLLPQLRPLLPPGVELMRHVEPFLGGGAFFFGRTPERALLADVNPELVNVYLQVRDHAAALAAHLEQLGRDVSEEAFYRVRERYNRKSRLSDLRRAAMFVYLNKTCFNGLHRVNRRGEFNVPYGRYKRPRVVDHDALQAASLALQGADIQCQSFETLLEQARPGDFVYLDPPYEPVSRTASFTSYARGGFSQEDQTRLRDVFRALDRRGCKLMLSNSDVPFIRDLYAEWTIDVVRAARAINRNASGRGKVNEVVVRNYS